MAVLVESISHFLQAQQHAGLDGPFGNFEKLRDLAMGEALEVGHLQDAALLGGEVQERLADDDAIENWGFDAIVVGEEMRDIVDGAGAAQGLLLAQDVDAEVAHQAAEPGDEGGLAGVETVRVAPDAEERFLYDILGEILTAQDADGDREGETAVLAVEIAQGFIVAVRDALKDRFCVGGRPHDRCTLPMASQRFPSWRAR